MLWSKTVVYLNNFNFSTKCVYNNPVLISDICSFIRGKFREWRVVQNTKMR